MYIFIQKCKNFLLWTILNNKVLNFQMICLTMINNLDLNNYNNICNIKTTYQIKQDFYMIKEQNLSKNVKIICVKIKITVKGNHLL